MNLSKLQWPSIVLLSTIIAAIVICAALGVDKEAIAIIGALGVIAQSFAPGLKERDTDGIPVVLLALVIPLLVSGCGAAVQVSTGAACASLMTAVGERHDYAPERAHADIDSVAAVCHRLEVVDGGGAP